MQKSDYSHARHTRMVLEASNASGTAIAVLLAACSVMFADFYKPETTFTKDDLCELLNSGRRAVAVALKELREEGTLVPVRHFAGGKGNAVTYRLCVPGQGSKAGASAVGKGRGLTPDEVRERKFRSLSRKFGAIQALEMMDRAEDIF